MFFTLSKIFWTIAQPLNAICLLLILGGLIWVIFSKKVGRFFMTMGVTALVIFGVLPVGPALMVWLERQYPAPDTLPEKIDGIIVLGGALESYLSKANQQVAANDNVERLICFQDLAQKYPDAKLVYSSGAGDILNPDAMEGDDARAYFKITGLGRDIIYEEKSRNTYENALYTKELMQPDASENWVVISSAYHMPRAIGIFAKQAWDVIPFACDRRTNGQYSDIFRRLPSVTGNFAMLNIALKEITGTFIYYVTGKTAFIVPAARVALPHE